MSGEIYSSYLFTLSLLTFSINCNCYFHKKNHLSNANIDSLVYSRYDRIRGRHVVANRKIKRGDVLFIEKAYFTAPIFTQIHEIVLVKCYYCLNDVKSPIP